MGASVRGNAGAVYNPTVTEFQAANPSVLIAPPGPLLFAEDSNGKVIKVDPNTGVVTLVAGNVDGTDAVANVTCLDQGNQLSNTVQFTVIGVTPPPPPPPPVADTMNLSYTPAAKIHR